MKNQEQFEALVVKTFTNKMQLLDFLKENFLTMETALPSVEPSYAYFREGAKDFVRGLIKIMEKEHDR